MKKALVARSIFVTTLALTAGACGQSRSSSGDGAGTAGQAATPVTTTTPTTTSKPVTPEPAATPAKTAAPAAPGGRGPDGLPADIPTTRSKVPTLAEWDAAGEITVARSTPLGCETKMVREWLRVSCRGKSHTGGKPENVTKIEGCSAETLLYSKTAVTTSLVSPVLRGKSCEVRFTWTNDRAAWLSVDWAAGSPRPVIAFRE